MNILKVYVMNNFWMKFVSTLFYKHHFYKHRQPEICPNPKHQPSTNPRLTLLEHINFCVLYFLFSIIQRSFVSKACQFSQILELCNQKVKPFPLLSIRWPISIVNKMTHLKGTSGSCLVWYVSQSSHIKEYHSYSMVRKKHRLRTISGKILKILKHQQLSFESYWCL